jgi:ankyrin repeat protein
MNLLVTEDHIDPALLNRTLIKEDSPKPSTTNTNGPSIKRQFSTNKQQFSEKIKSIAAKTRSLLPFKKSLPTPPHLVSQRNTLIIVQQLLKDGAIKESKWNDASDEQKIEYYDQKKSYFSRASTLLSTLPKTSEDKILQADCKSAQSYIDKYTKGYQDLQHKAIMSLCKEGSIVTLKTKIEALNAANSLSLLYRPDSLGKNALHYAIESGREDFVQTLLESGIKAKDFFVKDHENNTLWHSLASTKSMQGKNIDSVLALITMDNPNINNNPFDALTEVNNEGYNPISLAAREKNMAFLSRLFAPFDRNSISENMKEDHLIKLKSTPLTNPAYVLLKQFANKELKADEPERLYTMMFFLASTAPALFERDEKNRSLGEIAKEMIDNDITIPDTVMNLINHTEYFASEMKNAEKSIPTLMQNEKESLLTELNETKIQLQTLSAPGNTLTVKELNIKIENLEKILQNKLTFFTPPSVRDLPAISLIMQNEKKAAQADAKGNNFWHKLANPKSQEFKDHNANTEAWLNNAIKTKLIEANSEGLTPIHVAAQTGNLKILENLCDPTRRYNDIIDWTTPTLSTEKNPLYYALQNYNQDPPVYKRVIELLISKNPEIVKKAGEVTIGQLKEGITDAQLIEMLNNPEKLRQQAQIEKQCAAYKHQLISSIYADIKPELENLKISLKKQFDLKNDILVRKRNTHLFH